MRALVALSGGVDSSIAAARMVEAGHEVVGVTLKQWEGGSGASRGAGCCGVGDAADARSVAARLDIPYYVLDYVAEFEEAVVDPFGAGYLAGRTPNPCIECNRRIRFRALLQRTVELGCDVLVTGHHARIDGNGRLRLLRGVDRAKDQSYVLFMLQESQLSRIRFPVGEMTKRDVRATAARLGLRTADKPESQDLCFVGAGDYREFLRRRYRDADRPGDVVDVEGNRLGGHRGTAGFTIGQRKGLGVALGEARYVVDIRPESATVVVGTRDDLLAAGCRVEGVSFVAGGPPDSPEVEVQIRYRSPPVSSHLAPGGEGSWIVRFDTPQAAVAPGQAAVFYRGDEVLGGGTIAERTAR